MGWWSKLMDLSIRWERRTKWIFPQRRLSRRGRAANDYSHQKIELKQNKVESLSMEVISSYVRTGSDNVQLFYLILVYVGLHLKCTSCTVQGSARGHSKILYNRLMAFIQGCIKTHNSYKLENNYFLFFQIFLKHALFSNNFKNNWLEIYCWL